MELSTDEDVFLLRFRNDVGLVMFSTVNVFVLQSRLRLFKWIAKDALQWACATSLTLFFKPKMKYLQKPVFNSDDTYTSVNAQKPSVKSVAMPAVL